MEEDAGGRGFAGDVEGQRIRARGHRIWPEMGEGGGSLMARREAAVRRHRAREALGAE